MNRPFIVTIFGAESTGKTTLSKSLARQRSTEWREEFARRYLETTKQAVTTESMRAIWRGQKALQEAAKKSTAEYVVQDTDLFSTVGYWQLPHVEPRIGTCPTGLKRDALALKSDLYIITSSNIPFAADVLRFGGDKRESTDFYWINLCKQYELPYVVLSASDPIARIKEAAQLMNERRLQCVAL